MKKFGLLFVTVVLMTIALSLSVFAASGLNADEQALLERAFNEGIVIDGEKLVVPAEFKTYVENYLNRDDVDVTPAQAAAVIEKIDDVKALASDPAMVEWAKTGSGDIAKLPAAAKTKILTAASDASAVLDLKLTYDSSAGVVNVADESGSTVVDNVTVVKKTGETSMVLPMLLVSMLTVVLGGSCVGAVVVSRRRQTI